MRLRDFRIHLICERLKGKVFVIWYFQVKELEMKRSMPVHLWRENRRLTYPEYSIYSITVSFYNTTLEVYKSANYPSVDE